MLQVDASYPLRLKICIVAARSQSLGSAVDCRENDHSGSPIVFNDVCPMITPSLASHFRPISSQDLASWLREHVPERLWSVDGEERLSAHLDFPCSTEDLATALGDLNQQVQVMVPDTVEQLDASNLGSAILHSPVAPGDSKTYMLFNLYWEGQDSEDAWSLLEDLTEDS